MDAYGRLGIEDILDTANVVVMPVLRQITCEIVAPASSCPQTGGGDVPGDTLTGIEKVP